MKAKNRNIISLIYLVVAAIIVGGCSSTGQSGIADDMGEIITKPAFSCVCRGTIIPDQALFWALVDRGISSQAVESFRIPLSQVLDMRKIYPGDRYKLVHDTLGKVEYFELVRSPWERYVVVRNGEELVACKDTVPLTRIIFAAEGVVENTLWESMRKADIEPQSIMNFTDVLAYDFDFVTDTRNGHKFKIIYEKQAFCDSIISVGKVLLAQYETPDTTHTAIWFIDPDEREGYFDMKGKSMMKSLLKAPLTYSRISSRFTHSRFHPILKIYRPHLGVDYAAPTGTPVIASGSGKILFAGWKGGYGNFIQIKHDNGIETQYGHLSKFAKGIKKGIKVRRGQVIGYVGSTGLSTGPHLDYRVKVKGKFVNPEKYAFPAGPPVEKKYRDAYKKYARTIVIGAQILASANISGNM